MSNITISFNNLSLVPTPAVSINTEYLTVGSGISKIHTINLNGLLFCSGITGLISGIETPNATGILNINSSSYAVKTLSSSLEPTNDNWSTTIRYSMSFEGVRTDENPAFNTSTNWLVSKIQDDWSIDPLDENFKYITEPNFDTKLYTQHLASDLYSLPDYPFFKITRTIGAVGRYETNNPNVLNNAKNWVDNYITQSDSTPSSFLTNFSNIYNHVRNISKSVTEGSYIITDTWVASRGGENYIQTLNIQSSLDRDALRTVTIDGEIKGLSNANKTWTDPGASGLIIPAVADAAVKYNNALARYDAISNTFTGMATSMLVETSRNTSNMVYDNNFRFKTEFNRNESNVINPIPLSSGTTHNKTEGSVKFNITFNNRPINYFNGISENINVQDSIGMSKIITQLVMYGPPVLQDLGTKASNTRTISIDAKFANDPTVQSTITYYNTLKTKKDSVRSLVTSLDPGNVLKNISSPNLEIKSFLKDSSAKIDVANNSVSCNATYEWVFKGK